MDIVIILTAMFKSKASLIGQIRWTRFGLDDIMQLFQHLERMDNFLNQWLQDLVSIINDPEDLSGISDSRTHSDIDG